MTLIRWNANRDMDTLQRRFERLFDDMLVPTNWKEFSGFTKIPAAELSETDEAIILKLEIPGIDPNDLDIQVTEDAVSISGERKAETKSDENGAVRSEFHYGQFKRVIPLPKKIDNTNVKANYKDGILHLNLPKTEADKHKVVKVDVKIA